MPINNKKLQDIFGSDSSENDENMSSELDIADDADDNGFPLNLNAQDDDDLIPPAPVFRDPEALPVTQISTMLSEHNAISSISHNSLSR